MLAAFSRCSYLTGETAAVAVKLPDEPVHRRGASGNVEGGIWEGREPMLAAAPALPGDQAGLWERCAGEELLVLLLSSRAAVSGLPAL